MLPYNHFNHLSSKNPKPSSQRHNTDITINLHDIHLSEKSVNIRKKLFRHKTEPKTSYLKVSAYQLRNPPILKSSVINLNKQFKCWKSQFVKDEESKEKKKEKGGFRNSQSFMGIIKKKEEIREKKKVQRILDELGSSLNVFELRERWEKAAQKKDSRQNTLNNFRKSKTSTFYISNPKNKNLIKKLK